MKYSGIAIFALALTGCGGSSSPDAADTADVKVEETVAPAAEAVPTSILSATVERGETPGDFVLTWETDPALSPLRIEASSDPELIPGEGELVGEFTDVQEAVWSVEDPDERKYFAFIPENGEPVKAAVRLLPLEGGRNFRDIGGYQTADGQHVKWGHVFRSGVMHELTDDDYDYLEQLGIRTVCDYRSEEERTNEPTDWRAGAIDYKFFPDPESAENPR